VWKSNERIHSRFAGQRLVEAPTRNVDIDLRLQWFVRFVAQTIHLVLSKLVKALKRLRAMIALE